MTQFIHPEVKVFKIGQVWENTYGVQQEIIQIEKNAEYPIITHKATYTNEGQFLNYALSPYDLLKLVSDTEPTKETPEFIHPDSKTVFEVGQVWENGNGAQEKITEILCGHSFPIKTTDGRYTKNGHWHDEGTTRLDLKTLCEEHKTTKIKRMTKAPKYTHKNGTVFAVGQDWLTENNKIVKILQITDIVHYYDYPINTTGGYYTKDGNWRVEGKDRFDLKTLCEEHEATKETK